MRLFSVVLAVAGVALAIVLPLAGVSSLTLLGIVCLIAAGFIAARRAERPGARAALRIGAVVAAFALLVAPAVVTGIRNGQGIAWSVPAGERIELAEAGFAVTRDETGHVMTGRDLATGRHRWRVRLPTRGFEASQVSVQRVGGMLIVHGRAGELTGLELASGRRRWSVDGGQTTIPAIASPEVFAFERCEDGCVAEAHSVRDGRLRWRADDPGGDGFLGAPRTSRDDTLVNPLWPSSVAMLRSGERRRRYEVRDLAGGRVLARSERDGGLTAGNGSTVVHADVGGDAWATDPFTGRELWRRADDGERVSRSADAPLRTVGLPAGSIVLAHNGDELPLLIAGDLLRLVDPRTGKLTERPNRLLGGVDVVAAPAPPVTAETAKHGVPAGIPVLAKTFEGEAVQADGRVYETKNIQSGSVAATATQVGWESAQPVFLRDDSEDGAEVRDRRTGERVARYAGDDVFIQAIGERLILVVGDGDAQREYVVAT